MKKSSYIVFGRDGVKILSEPAAASGRLSRAQTEEAWDVVIRAHYLAHEMRYYCTGADRPLAEATRLAAAALESWATQMGAALETPGGRN